MTILLRDDFTGSGILDGRTPDGVSSGAWVHDTNWSAPVRAANASISGGRLTAINGTGSGFTAWAFTALGPLAGNPVDAYVQARVLGGGSLSFGVRIAGADGVWVNVISASGTSVTIKVVTDGPNGFTLPPTGIGSGTFPVTSSSDYVVRMEVEGADVRAYLDGVQVLGPTLGSVGPGGGIHVASLSTVGGTPMEYVEGGDFLVPASAFWTSMVGAREVV